MIFKISKQVNGELKHGRYDSDLQKEIIPCKYDEVWDWNLNDGFARVKLDNKWFEINTKGERV